MAEGSNERGHRVRVGLTGLAAVLVIVAAVAAVFEGVRQDPEERVLANAALANSTDSPKEPLAEIGVVPPSEAANSTLQLVPDTPPRPVEPTPPPTPID